jgi:hypothetical protein
LLNGFVQRRFQVGIVGRQNDQVVLAQRTKMNFDPRISLPMRLLGKTTGIRSLIVLGRRQASIDED